MLALRGDTPTREIVKTAVLNIVPTSNTSSSSLTPLPSAALSAKPASLRQFEPAAMSASYWDDWDDFFILEAVTKLRLAS
jgi:hypothetical protein